MANKNKAKGTKAETRVVNYLADFGIQAERRALSGAEDKGDIKLINEDIIFEVKSGKQTTNPNRTQLDEWMSQTVVEGKNSGCSAFLVIARHGKNPRDYDVWQSYDCDAGWTHWYLDEWCLHYPYISS